MQSFTALCGKDSNGSLPLASALIRLRDGVEYAPIYIAAPVTPIVTGTAEGAGPLTP